MKRTVNDVAQERIRAIREHTPMRFQQCRYCEEIQEASAFSKSGRKKNQCRSCGRLALAAWKEAGGHRDKRSAAYHALKFNARSRGVQVEISSREFREWMDEELEDGVCFYCQATLNPYLPHSLEGVTIDRMDSMLGYALGNMVLACRRCNLVKGNWFSFDEMIEIGEKYLKDKPY